MAVDLFPPQSSSELTGPEWLRARRATAAAALSEWDLPTTDLEEWRYSRIRDLHPERFSTLGGAAEGTAEAGRVPVPAAAIIAELGDLAGVVVVHNGVAVQVELAAELEGTGVVFGPAGDADEGLLGAAIDHAPDAFAQLNDAFAPTPVVLSVPRSTTVELPFALVSYTDVEGVTAFPRLSVVAGENSELSVVEVALSADVEALVAPVTELVVGNAARVRHSSLQDLGPRVWQIASLVATVGQDATLRSSGAALGGDVRPAAHRLPPGGPGRPRRPVERLLRRRRPDARPAHLPGARAPRTPPRTCCSRGRSATTRTRSTPASSASSPTPGAPNAVQTNRNLKLSEHAWAESVPNLEIENNDVHCSHASTVGPVDEDQRFYLESRGVPTAVADRLIVGGFFDEVLDDLPVPQLAESVRAGSTSCWTARWARPTRRPRAPRDHATRLCALDDLVDGEGARFDVDGRSLAVVRLGDDVYVIGDTCSHADVSLSEGEVDARRLHHRVPEARQRVRSAHGRAPRRCRRCGRCRSTKPCRRRTATWWWS